MPNGGEDYLSEYIGRSIDENIHFMEYLRDYHYNIMYQEYASGLPGNNIRYSDYISNKKDMSDKPHYNPHPDIDPYNEENWED